MKILIRLTFLVMLFFVSTVPALHAGPDIRFGTLPVLQALPLFVAAEKGFFREQGLNVELVTSNSALEKDIAFTSNRISGYFGDILTCMILRSHNMPIKIVSVLHNAITNQRMFAFVVSSKYAGRHPREAISEGLAVSSNTILDFLTTKLLSSKGIPLEQAKLVEIKSIPIRLQMFTSGQVPAAVLPEPLATLAESKGGIVVADDAGKGWSPTVLAFHDAFLSKYPDTVKAFHRAVEKASTYINKNPEEARAIMNRECRIPELFRKSFPVPQFPKLALPTQTQITDVFLWCHQKGIVKNEIPYKQMVADGYLP